MPGLILGSTSGYRRALMERLRVPFTQAGSSVDEDAVKRKGGEPQAIVQQLAKEKALAVFHHNRAADSASSPAVIGCDQAATIDGELLDKPGDEAGAIAQLRQLRGKEHRLLTAVAIAHATGRESPALIEFVDVTRLTMRKLTDGEVERYVQTEQPFDCAGSYKIESLGIALFERIDSRDQTAITGLPLLQLTAELRGLGFAIP